VKTLLERAKGSALDIRSAFLGRAEILALLSPHAQRFRSLDFAPDHWSNIQGFSEATSGPLPLLRTLKIDAVEGTISPSLPLFSGAVNLKNFFFCSEGVPPLNYFAFPNLTTFEFSAGDEVFPISRLLNFLESLPTLQTVRITIEAELLLGDVPLERVIVLPNVEVFSVTQGEPDYRIAPHISCPSARRISLVREQDVEFEVPQETFPTWNTIGPQYVASTIDKIALGITIGEDLVSISLSFVSPGSATLELGYKIITGDEDSDEPTPELGWQHTEVLSHALEAILTHPLLSNVKHLHIWTRHPFSNLHPLTNIVKEARELFKFVGPLGELILDIDDLRLFLSPFFDLPESQASAEQVIFPSIKTLIIVKQPNDPLDEECVVVIVGFVKSQHMRGVPFERVVFHTKSPPAGMAERLEPWVCTVNFSVEMISTDDQDSI